jgi:hypothetical protein
MRRLIGLLLLGVLAVVPGLREVPGVEPKRPVPDKEAAAEDEGDDGEETGEARKPVLVLDSGGHTAAIQKVLFTPDGKQVVTVSNDKTVRVWDVATAPPRTRLIRRNEADVYATRANRITVRHRHGRVVAVIKIVSPGNKGSRNELRAFVEESAELIRQEVNLLVIDLFPPAKRDPQGIHKAIWDEFVEEDFAVPPDRPLTLVSCDAGPERVACVESVAVGDVLPDMPLFLKPEHYVPAPLEATYGETWKLFPTPLMRLLEGPPPGQSRA